LGLDFDNTIVDYDTIFRDVAVDAGYLPSTFRGTKTGVRDALRAQPSGETLWQQVQAAAYGPRLIDARPYDGFDRFVARCRQLSIPLFVISHKSERAAADPAGTNLRRSAAAWLEAHFGEGAFEGIFFEDTRALKIARIELLQCTHAIDDLLEVLQDPAFPAGIVPWLFDPSSARSADIESFESWAELLERVEEERSMIEGIARLTDGRPRTVRRCRGGGNNRVFRVENADGALLAVKAYGKNDDRGRLAREFAGLSFLARNAMTEVPKTVAGDIDEGLAAYEWVEGEAIVKPEAGDMRAVLRFVNQIDALRKAPGASSLALAADAATSTGELWRQIDARAQRLKAIAVTSEPELRAYLNAFDEIARSLRGPAVSDIELPAEKRTLSPSDFGFHNALRRDGRLVFLDFEYFGWDDPVKLTVDFVLHPGMDLTSADTKEWLEGVAAIYGRDPDFPGRLRRLYPILALKWCLIILNEFVPAAWARRVASGRHRAAGPAKVQQLAKATALLSRVAAGESIGDLRA
jgi:hypothetical protein